jgi:hypothetical protein
MNRNAVRSFNAIFAIMKQYSHQYQGKRLLREKGFCNYLEN